MIKVRDTWFRLLLILIPFTACIYFNGTMFLPFSLKRLEHSLVSLLCTILVCEGSRWVIYHSRQWKKVNSKASLRFTYSIIAGLTWSTLVLMLSAVMHRFISTGHFDTAGVQITSKVYVNERQLSFGFFGYSFFNALVAFLFLLGVYETIYHYARLRSTEKEKEKLEKEKLKAELSQLKGIVNPHFLFNNLNSLSSLISDDPVQAEAFLDELTKVFRYLLRNNETELTTLAQELQFIQSYYHLLQTRYGTGINLHIQIDKEHESLLIPPLTLQLLVENAAKHNQLQKSNPLRIELLSAPDKKLVIRNTVCKKDGIVESTGIGLQNINARYKMLQQPGLVVEHNTESFAVIIPLIETDTALQTVKGIRINHDAASGHLSFSG